MSPLLQRIERELEATDNPSRRAELIAEQASYFARVGEFTRAKDNIEALRSEFSSGARPRVSILIMLAEGLLLYYEKFDQSATDRIVRANALSAAVGANDLVRLTASWLAHMEFNRSNFRGMESALKQCAPSNDPAGLTSDARVRLVVANSFAYCGDVSMSRHWYGEARRDAITLGDEALIEAVIFNRAAFSLTRYRIDSLGRKLDDDVVRSLELEIASARSYFLGARHGSLPQLLEACSARIDFMRGRYSAAEAKFAGILQKGMHSAFLPDRLLISAEHAKCKAELGQPESIREVLASISANAHTGMGLDDQILLVAIAIDLAVSIGEMTTVETLRKAKREIEEKYSNEVEELRQILERVVAEWTP